MNQKHTAAYNWDSFLDWILLCLELEDTQTQHETASYVNSKGRLVLTITME
jgi:hypothetical protein